MGPLVGSRFETLKKTVENLFQFDFCVSVVDMLSNYVDMLSTYEVIGHQEE